MLAQEAYINSCTAKIKELIQSGENHISVSMPAGFGRNKVISELMDDFIAVTVITEHQKIVDFLTEELVSIYGDIRQSVIIFSIHLKMTISVKILISCVNFMIRVN